MATLSKVTGYVLEPVNNSYSFTFNSTVSVDSLSDSTEEILTLSVPAPSNSSNKINISTGRIHQIRVSCAVEDGTDFNFSLRQKSGIVNPLITTDEILLIKNIANFYDETGLDINFFNKDSKPELYFVITNNGNEIITGFSIELVIHTFTPIKGF